MEEKEVLSKSLINDSLEEIEQYLKLFHLPFSWKSFFLKPHSHVHLTSTRYCVHSSVVTH